jgi:predicted  nucleic acid-binding Zn-ribbon protein
MLALEGALEMDKLLFAWKENLCISSGDWNILTSLIQDLEARKAVLEDELQSHRKKEEDEGLRATDDTTLAQLVQVLRDPETHVARLRGLREKTDYLEKRLRFMTDHGDDLKVRLRDTTIQINTLQINNLQQRLHETTDQRDSLDTASRSLIGSLGSTLEQ